MSCSACPTLAERYCPKCQRRYCTTHDGHTQSGKLHWCPWCTKPRKMVYLEKFGDRTLGFAQAPDLKASVGDLLPQYRPTPDRREPEYQDEPAYPTDELGQPLVESSDE